MFFPFFHCCSSFSALNFINGAKTEPAACEAIFTCCAGQLSTESHAGWGLDPSFFPLCTLMHQTPADKCELRCSSSISTLQADKKKTKCASLHSCTFNCDFRVFFIKPVGELLGQREKSNNDNLCAACRLIAQLSYRARSAWQLPVLITIFHFSVSTVKAGVYF